MLTQKEAVFVENMIARMEPIDAYSDAFDVGVTVSRAEVELRIAELMGRNDITLHIERARKEQMELAERYGTEKAMDMEEAKLLLTHIARGSCMDIFDPETGECLITEEGLIKTNLSKEVKRQLRTVINGIKRTNQGVEVKTINNSEKIKATELIIRILGMESNQDSEDESPLLALLSQLTGQNKEKYNPTHQSPRHR